MKRFLLTLAVVGAVAGVASAHEKKPPKPNLDQTLQALQSDLQKSGWWQVVPVGENPNDATYINFLTDTFVSLGKLKLNGRDLERLICQASGDCE